MFPIRDPIEFIRKLTTPNLKADFNFNKEDDLVPSEYFCLNLTCTNPGDCPVYYNLYYFTVCISSSFFYLYLLYIFSFRTASKVNVRMFPNSYIMYVILQINVVKELVIARVPFRQGTFGNSYWNLPTLTYVRRCKCSNQDQCGNLNCANGVCMDTG